MKRTLILTAVAALLLGAVAARAQSTVDWQMDCLSGHWEVQGTTITCYLADDATPTPTPTATPTSRPTATPTPTATPAGTGSTTNLLVNGDFSDGWTGWSQVNDYWLIHQPIDCEPTGTSYAEMDRDGTSADRWPVGGEDWLWQDVEATVAHTGLTFTMIESHHMDTGEAQLTIYGSNDEQTWDVVFHRPEPEAEWGAGKCSRIGPPEVFTYSISTPGYAWYRVEMYGYMPNDDNSGFLWGGLELMLVE